MTSNKTLIIGHRGASALLPENTLESFRLAFENANADMIEFDVHLSRDKVPVVIHDETLERTTNGQGAVAQASLKELKALDAGYHFDPGGTGVFTQRGKKILIPTLEEVFQAFPEKRLAIEIKAPSHELTRQVLSLVEKYNAAERCILGSLEDSVFQDLREISAPTKIFTSRKQALRLLIEYYFKRSAPRKEPKLVASLPVDNKFFNFKKSPWINWLHQKEVTVYYWTVNDPAMMQELASRGADGIMSDDPGLLHQTLPRNSGTVPEDA